MKIQLDKKDLYFCAYCGIPFLNSSIILQFDSKAGLSIEWVEDEEDHSSTLCVALDHDIRKVEELDDSARFEAEVFLATLPDRLLICETRL